MATKDFNKREHIDDYFREALSDHKISPNASTWRELRRQQWGKSYRNTYISLALLLFAAVAVVGYFSLFESETTDPMHSENNIIRDEGHRPGKDIAAEIAEAPVEQSQAKHQDPLLEEKKLNVPENAGIENPVLAENNNAVERKNATAQIIQDENISFSVEPERRDTYWMFKMKMLNMDINPPPGNAGQIDQRSGEKFRINFRDDYARKANTSLSLNFTPGITYYKSKPQKNFYSFDISGNLELSQRLAFELGGGIYREKDNGRYLFNYESYDSVGYYMNVTSYFYDEDQDTVILNMKSVNVYDSVEHITVSNTSNTYTYFQIPFGLRYRMFEFSRFTFSVRAGAIFLLMMEKDIPEANLNMAGVELIHVEDETPDRLNTAWKYYAAVQISYQMSGNLFLTLEPVYQQYFGKLYRRDNFTGTKHPYSIGFRTGLTFKF